MNIDVIFSFLGQLLLTGGGGAVVAYALFTYLGKSWIENRLAKDLEAAKAEISLLAARKLKLHDQEYVVFPEIWAKMNNALSSVGKAIISFRQIPDPSKMSETELTSWIGESDLSKEERNYLLKSEDKFVAYNRILDLRSLNQAWSDFFNFKTYLQANRIFLDPLIKEKLDLICEKIRTAWFAKKMDWDGFGQEEGKRYLLEAFNQCENEAQPILKEIEALVQERFFPKDRA